MPHCVMCDVFIPTKNAMCCYCWTNTLSSKKEMFWHGKIQKNDGENSQMAK